MFLAMACLIPYNVYDDKTNKATYGAVLALFLFLIAFGWCVKSSFSVWVIDPDSIFCRLVRGSSYLGCFPPRSIPMLSARTPTPSVLFTTGSSIVRTPLSS